jgi:hypothetical protein
MGVTYCNLKPTVKDSRDYHEIRWNVKNSSPRHGLPGHLVFLIFDPQTPRKKRLDRRKPFRLRAPYGFHLGKGFIPALTSPFGRLTVEEEKDILAVNSQAEL